MVSFLGCLGPIQFLVKSVERPNISGNYLKPLRLISSSGKIHPPKKK